MISTVVLCRYKEYADRVPDSSEDFQSGLGIFYSSFGKTVASPIMDKQPMDLFCIFREVARLGGFESVSFNR